MKQILFVAVTALTLVSGCSSIVRATDGTDFLTGESQDNVIRTPGNALTVDGRSYLVTEVVRQYSETPGGGHLEEHYDEVNVRGRLVRCRPSDDCVALVRRALAEMNDGDGM